MRFTLGSKSEKEFLEGDILQFQGEENGPTSLILVGVHGNEHCGIKAMKEILPTLEIDKGTVFIGIGNPKAVEQNIRFVEANLNRMFKDDDCLNDLEKKSYEYERAQFLKSYMDKSEVLLDIHASATPGSRVFAICENNAKRFVRYLPIDLVVSGFDSVEPGGTDYYMNKSGKVGICIECGYLGDEIATKIAKETIVSFLAVQGHIKSSISEKKQSKIFMNKIYFTKTDSFLLARSFKDFEEIKKDELIGLDGGEEVRVLNNSIILFARNRNKIGEEAFLLGEYLNT